MKTKIPVFKPLLEAEEFAATRGALEMGWLGMGSYVGEFEAALHRMLGAPVDRQVVAVSTGHAAIHLSLLLAGVGPGDEVITPSFNNICDFQAIQATGADIVFCDINDDTLCLNLDQVEQLISPRTKVLIATDYFCHLCDHERVQFLAERHRLRVIHDAAHSLGSHYRGRPVGSFSDLSVFSFDPVKTFTCIDGGAVVVRSAEEARNLQETRLVGMGQRSATLYANDRSWTYDVTQLGFRYHMANLHAALGLSQLAKREEITASRQAACRRYSELFAEVAEVRVPATDFAHSAPFGYYIRVPAARRDQLRANLDEHGIGTGIHWQPGHWFSLFKQARRGDLTVTDRVGLEILTLPLHSKMAMETVDQVAGVVRAFFRD